MTDTSHPDSGSDGRRRAATIDPDAVDGLAAASDEEAAAIIAALGAHRRAQAAAAAAASEDEPTTDQRSWRLAGRLSGLGVTTNRPPSSTSADDWTAASRADRF